MKNHVSLAVVLCLLSAVPGASGSMPGAPDLSGTWIFSVDLESGGHGDPTFIFKQEGDKLTGTYKGPLGEQKVTGTVKDDQAVFGFEVTSNGEPVKVTYTGTIESATRMTGSVEFSSAQRGNQRGKWTATKKES
jgi:hypothetical protein